MNSKAAAQLVRQKLLLMGQQIEFLEYVWNNLSEREKVEFVNNYPEHVPEKYK